MGNPTVLIIVLPVHMEAFPPYDTMVWVISLKEVWSNVCREPPLQPLTGEVLRYRTALTDDYVRPKETQNRTKNQCTMSRDYRIYGKSSNN